MSPILVPVAANPVKLVGYLCLKTYRLLFSSEFESSATRISNGSSALPKSLHFTQYTSYVILDGFQFNLLKLHGSFPAYSFAKMSKEENTLGTLHLTERQGF